jgi:hypothetical protein
MTTAFNAVEELRRHGMCGDEVSPDIERTINTLTRPQVEVFVKVKERVDALSSDDVQRQSAADGSLALAMMQVMSWDSPVAEAFDPEVEGMAEEPRDVCACLCTGAGGGAG